MNREANQLLYHRQPGTFEAQTACPDWRVPNFRIADNAAISTMRKCLSMAHQAAITESDNETKIPASIVAVLAGVGAGSWVFHLYLWSRFMETQPRIPRPVEGLIYPLNNHGWVYYLSAAQSIQLWMMVWLAFVFLLFAAVLGRMRVKRWSLQSLPASASSLLYFAAGLLVWIAVLSLWSLKLASALVARGFTL
jgi:hypothetical protein